MAVPLLQAAEVSQSQTAKQTAGPEVPQSQVAKQTARPEVPHVLCPSRAPLQYLFYIHLMVKASYLRQSQAASLPLGSLGTFSRMSLEHARVKPVACPVREPPSVLDSWC